MYDLFNSHTRTNLSHCSLGGNNGCDNLIGLQTKQIVGVCNGTVKSAVVEFATECSMFTNFRLTWLLSVISIKAEIAS